MLRKEIKLETDHKPLVPLRILLRLFHQLANGNYSHGENATALDTITGTRELFVVALLCQMCSGQIGSSVYLSSISKICYAVGV